MRAPFYGNLFNRNFHDDKILCYNITDWAIHSRVSNFIFNKELILKGLYKYVMSFLHYEVILNEMTHVYKHFLRVYIYMMTYKTWFYIVPLLLWRLPLISLPSLEATYIAMSWTNCDYRSFTIYYFMRSQFKFLYKNLNDSLLNTKGINLMGNI
jgi:hypothetical protein